MKKQEIIETKSRIAAFFLTTMTVFGRVNSFVESVVENAMSQGGGITMEYRCVRDGQGGEWVVDVETQRAMPVIRGGEADWYMESSETCPYHKHTKLTCMHDQRLEQTFFGVVHFWYCPDMSCNFVSPRSDRQGNPVIHFRDKDMLLLQLEIFRRKFVAQFAGDGR